MAALFMAQAILVQVEVRQTVTDSLFFTMNLFMLGSLWLLYAEDKPKKSLICCFWLAMALGIFIKGISPILALIVVISLSFVDRDISWLRKLKPFYGLTCVFILSLLWLIVFNIKYYMDKPVSYFFINICFELLYLVLQLLLYLAYHRLWHFAESL
jgi:4-amino-4-deoxy-L-arabinose transferase-like glycosyltransferase